MENVEKKRKYLVFVASFVAIVFGGLTIKSGAFALFGGEEGKNFAGNYVPFVLWFNFLAGFFYIIGGIGLLKFKSWAVKLSIVLAGSSLLIYALFGIHVLNGGAYQLQTVVAMAIRCIVWVGISIIGIKCVKNYSNILRPE